MHSAAARRATDRKRLTPVPEPVGDWVAPVAAKILLRDFDARSRLPPFVFGDIEQMLERLQADAAQAAEARAVLRTTPAPVLREALRLRAARIEITNFEATR